MTTDYASQSPRLSHAFSLYLDYPGHTPFLASLVLAGTASWESCLRACGLRASASASPPSGFLIPLTINLRCLPARGLLLCRPGDTLRVGGSPKKLCDLNQMQSVLSAKRCFKTASRQRTTDRKDVRLVSGQMMLQYRPNDASSHNVDRCHTQRGDDTLTSSISTNDLLRPTASKHAYKTVCANAKTDLAWLQLCGETRRPPGGACTWLRPGGKSH